MRAWEENQFVFVCGLHRSGTSLLFQMLREHPDISGFKDTGVQEDEGQHLQTVFPPAKKFGGAGKFALDSRSHMDEHSGLDSPADIQRLCDEWSPHWDMNARYLLEKSPPTLVRSRYFQHICPQSKFVVVLRHPLAVSLATQKWSKNGIKPLIKHWLAAHEKFEADRSHLKQVHVVYYEQLIVQPDEELEKIYRFLDLPSVPNPVEVKGAINEKYFAQWEAMNQKSIFRMCHQGFLKKMEPRIKRFGYSLLSHRDMPVVE